MGQKVGKASFDRRVKPFVNLPGGCIRALWQEFNLCATGWGVDPVFFDQLCRAMATSMGVEPDESANKAFFSALDTDKNDLVDGLELISTLGILSGMTREEKVEFVFACYDVGGRSRLNMNELFLLLKSTSVGLCKLSGADAPDSARLEAIASLVFMSNKNGMEGGLTLDTLSSYCDTNPVALSWLAFYDDCEGQDRNDDATRKASLATLEAAAPDIHYEETFFKQRSETQEKANAGTDNGTAVVAPKGAWVEAAKELVPPPPPPEEEEDAGGDANADDEESATAAGKGDPLTPKPPPPAPPAPDTQLSLEWVYGYSAALSRASVCYAASGPTSGVGRVVYPAGKVAVVLSPPVDEEGAEIEGDRVQAFMQEHTDEITALAVSPCRKWVATGETGASPKVAVWSASTRQIKNTIAGFHTVGIAGVAWSPCGSLLASIGADEFHSLQIMEAFTAQPVFRVRTGLSRPLGMAWTGDGSSLVTCGQTSTDSPPLVFWVKEASTGSFVKKRGIAGAGSLASSSDIQLVVCAAPGKVKAFPTAIAPPCMVSGTAGGGLCLWKGRNCSKAVVDAHSGAVEALSVGDARGGVVASGGRDAKVKLWSGIDLTPLATIDVMGTPSVAGLRQVRSVCLSSDGTTVLVGTLGSDILELAAVEKQKGADGEDEGEEEEAEDEAGDGEGAPRTKPSGIGRMLNGGQPLACGHCKGEATGVDGELRSVDVSPQGDQFVTVGDDGTVRVWANGEKKISRTLNMGSPALSVSYSPDASFIAVGLSGGGVSVVKPSEEDASALILEKNLDCFQGAGTGVTCVRFSPNGATLTAGGGNGSLKSWGAAEREWEAAGSAGGLVSGSVVCMDFTADGSFLMLNSSGMDMVVVNAETCKKASPKDMKALRGEGESGEVAIWATSTCTMTNGKQAAWATMLSDASGVVPVSDPSTPPGTTEENTLTASDLVRGGETPILLASDALGRVGLLRYPAQLPEPPAVPPTTEGMPEAPQREEGADVPAPSPEEETATAAAALMAQAVESAIPRVSVVKAHAGKVAAARQIGEGGGIVTLGATDRCVFQWAVALEEGEESGEDLPDPPACNAPGPKASAGGEDGEGEEEDNEGDGDEESPVAEAWSGDDEDLVDCAVKPQPEFTNGSQDISEFLAKRADSEDGLPAKLPWVGAGVGGSAAASGPCVPDADLKLEWIHGYSAQGSRQNLVYNRNGEIVYPAACAGVVMTKRTKPELHRQAYNLDHTQAITCLAMHPDRAHVATGQEGAGPFVLVWNSACSATKAKARLQLGSDKKGVSQVCFSADGQLLAVACEDKNHTVMVFRWASGLLRCQALLGVKKALSLCFSLNADELVAAGHKHFKVWTLSGGGQMQGKRGLFGSGSKVQTLTCAVAVLNGEEGSSSSFVLGGSSGNLLKLEGRKISSEIEAHEGPVYALYAYPAPDGSGTCLVSGGGDGKVKTWDAELGVVNEFDLVGRSYLWGTTPCIRSVCLNDHSDGRKILVGTSCSEIIEISANDGTDVNDGDCLMRGHFRDQLWGLAAHPAKPVYCSSGDEGTLKEWGSESFALKREINLEGWIRAVRYSPNGLLIACGMGGETDASSSYGGSTKRRPREENGTIKIVSGMEDAFRVVNTLSDAIGPISCIRFSPDGNLMAAASLDGNVYIYSVLENFKLECIGEGGKGGVMRIDFSSDGQWIRAEARGAGDAKVAQSTVSTILLSAVSGEVCEDVNVVDPETGFATWSGLCSDHVAGVWPPDAASPLDVASCCRSREGKLLATADARGEVKLFRYPAPGRAASFKAFKAHSPGVRSVCFLDKDKRSQHVISVGGRDRCIMQWRIIHAEDSASTSMEEASKDALPEKDPWVQAELSALNGTREVLPSLPRPWESGPGLAGVAPPSEASAPAGVKLALEFAHGYNSSGQARNNVGFSSSDRVILPCASVGVVYDKASHSQVLFTGHCGRVVSLAVSPCGRFVATGQEGRNASAIVWDPATGHRVCVLPTSLHGAVRKLSFSPDGRSLCGIGADRDSSLCIWGSASGIWTDGARVALGQGPRRAALFVAWTSGGGSSSYQVMTGGQNYVIFWTLTPNLSSRLGEVSTDPTGAATEPAGVASESNETVAAPSSSSASSSSVENVMAETFLCGVSIGKDASSSVAVTGTASGAFAVWKNFRCVRMVPGAHGTSAVLCLARASSGGFASGGSDGVVRVWSESLDAKGPPITVGSTSDVIRAVAVNKKESNMAVGTGSGRVVEISLDSGDTSVLLDGPAAALAAAGGGTACVKNRSAAAAHPKDGNVYVTAAADGYLRKWSADGRRLIAKLAVGEGALEPGGEAGAAAPGIGAMEWSSGGSFVACGLSSGDVVLMSPRDMVVLSRCPTNKKPNSAITAIAISLDEATLVVGCEDGSLHGMKISQGGVGVQHAWSNAVGSASTAILAMDMSSNGQTIRYCDASGTFSYVSSAGAAIDVAPAGDDASTWLSSKCFFGHWGVRAASSSGPGFEAAASTRSHGKSILAACADDGPISLWRYPASQEGASCVKGVDASVAAPAVLSFTADDSKLIAVGGKDNSILQWSITAS